MPDIFDQVAAPAASTGSGDIFDQVAPAPAPAAQATQPATPQTPTPTPPVDYAHVAGATGPLPQPASPAVAMPKPSLLYRAGINDSPYEQQVQQDKDLNDATSGMPAEHAKLLRQAVQAAQQYDPGQDPGEVARSIRQDYDGRGVPGVSGQQALQNHLSEYQTLAAGTQAMNKPLAHTGVGAVDSMTSPSSLAMGTTLIGALRQAPIRTIAGYIAGTLAGQGVEKAAAAAGATPEQQQIANSIGFFLPSVAARLAGVQTGTATTPEGDPAAAASAFGGKVGAAAVKTPEAYEVRVGVKGGPNVGVRIPRAPSAVDITAKDLLDANTEAMQDSAKADQAAQLIVKGATPEQAVSALTPKPPPTPQEQFGAQVFPNPAVISQATMASIAQVIKSLPPEQQPDAILEAHANLAKHIAAQQGKTILGPDGKTYQVNDGAKDGIKLASQFTNAAVDAHDSAQAEAQKQQAAATTPAPAEQPKGQSKLQAAKEKTQLARVATIIESQVPAGYEDNAKVIRSVVATHLGIPEAEAQPLIDKYRASKLPTVGSAAEPVVEEKPETIDAQMDALKAGTIRVVHVPAGGKYMPEQPKGIQKVTTPSSDPGAGTYFFKPGKGLRAETIKAASKAGTHGDLTGHITTKEEIAKAAQPVAVVAQKPDGTEIQASEVDGAKPQIVAAQAAILAERHPGAEIIVKHTDDVINDRLAKPDIFDQAAGEQVAAPSQSEGGPSEVIKPETNAAGEPEKTPAAPDRRKDVARRQRVSEMSPEDMRRELLTSQTVDLPNKRAFTEAESSKPAKAVAMSDADGLKALNDKFGYEAGNALLRAKAEALKEAGLDAYHDKGDEFLYRGDSAKDIAAKLDAARAILRDRIIEVTTADGKTLQFKGADFSFGTGENLDTAEGRLKEHKSEREARGERARGELRGIAEVGSGKSEVDKGAAEEKPAEVERTYDDVQKDIDKREDELEASGQQVTKLYFPDNAATLKDAPGWKPMPADLVKLYQERDAIGSGQLQESISAITQALRAAGITSDQEIRHLLEYYALDPNRTTGEKQYLAAEHTQRAAAEPLKDQVAKAYSVLAAERDIPMDDHDDLYRDRKTTIDAAKAVKAIVSYFRGESVDVDKFLPATTTPTAKSEPYAPVKGDRVRYTAKDGAERVGVLKQETALGVRIAPDGGGKPDFISKKKILGPAEGSKSATKLDNGAKSVAEAPIKEQNEPNGTQPEPAAVSENGGHPTAGGRPSADLRSEDRSGVGEVAPEVHGEPKGSGNLLEGSEGDGAPVHTTASGVSEAGTGAGHGAGSGTGIDSAPAGDVIEKAVKAAAKPKKLNQGWYSHPETWTPPPGTMGKLDANLSALRILRDIEKNPRMATPDEQAALASFVGWGALPNVFAPWRVAYPERRRYEAANEELRKLLSDEEYAAASRSTQNAHYTSPELVRYMWDLMKRFGFKGGNLIEPSMGSGNFLGMMPKALRANVTAVGNEMDPVTAGIAKLLYPGATIFNKDYVQLILPDNSLDLAISNVPFGPKVYDPKMPKLNAGVHDYFFVKSLDKVRPGGVVAFIASTGTMDKGNSNIRDLIASKADLVGAIRLPSGAFAKNAGTDVTTDLVILQKRAPGQDPKGPAWSKVVDVQVPGRDKGTTATVKLNEYFHDNPEMMLGTSGVSEMYGRDGSFALYPHEGRDFNELLEDAKRSLPRGIMLEDKASGIDQASTAAQFAKEGQIEGQYTLDDKGNLKQVVDGKLQSPPAIENADGTKSLTKTVRIKEMVGLRDKLNSLLAAMTELPDDEPSNAEIAKQRDALKRDYDKFIKKNGILNATANRIFEDDPHYPRLLALENYDSAKRVATPAQIFTQRTIFPRAELTSLSPNPHDALYQVLAERGRPDIAFMARLQGKEPAEVAKGLLDDGMIFRNPQSGEYEMKEKYLSGYVRDKLDDAKAAVKQGLKEYASNVAALEKVIPETVPIAKIEVKLGATWIPLPALSDFIRDVFKADGRVTNVGGVWNVSRLQNTPEVSTEYGTPDADAKDILEQSLNQREMKITYKDKDGVSHVDPKATLLARQKQQKIREAFNKWAAESKQWGPQLEKVFNYAYNNLVLPARDGSHLTFPGMNASVTLRPHQRDAVWMVIQEGRGLLAHVVGAGKTFEIAASIMEGRRIGSFRKPMLAVPNHLVDQWRSEFLHLYPGANLLVPTKGDFDAKNRQRLMAKVATGDYDAVILAHSQFNLMDISAERQMKTLQGQMDELVETINAMKSNRDDARTVKQMEKAKEQLRTRMAKLQDLKADKAINFDETGVDALFIDEAHAYKNLMYYTKMQRVAGLAQGDSKRATRLLMKTQYLQDKHNGRGVVFATGTPIQNTMAEQYTMTKYVAPDVLEHAGIKYFDDWAANFGAVQTKNELAADGSSIKARSKFSRFTNVPELMNMFRSFTDIKTAKMLNLPTPKLEGGKPQANYVQPSEALTEYVKSLVERAKNMPKDPRIDNMLKVVSDGRKAALDMRLIDPNAKDDPDSKINQVVSDVLNEWKAGKDTKTTQLVFLDMYRALEHPPAQTDDTLSQEPASTKPVERLNLYNDMRSKWVRAGIPKDEIAIIGDYDTDEKKAKLFAAVNSGDIRILMGSTEKMGAGMNVQRLLKVLHHVDLPWRPGDLAQRTGRIERQGNTNKEVSVKYWLTQRSFDTYMLNTLVTKAEFIEQLMSGTFKGRSIEDLDSTVSMNLQDMMVATSGNPDIKLKYDLEMEKEQLQTLQRGHQQELRENGYRAQNAHDRAVGYDALVAAQKIALAKYEAVKGADGKGFSLNIDGKKFADRKTAFEYLDAAKIPGANFHLQMNGVGFSVKTFSEARNQPILEYRAEYDGMDSTPPEQSMGSLGRSIESRLRNLADSIENHQQSAERNRADAAKYEKMTDTPFPEAKRLDEVKAELEAVDGRLGMKDEAPKDEVTDAVASDEPEETSDDDGEAGFISVGALPGVEAAAKFYTSDVAPLLSAVGKGTSEAAATITHLLVPTAGANPDVLDSMMRLKGDQEKQRFAVEQLFKGITKMWDKMPESQRIDFLDRYKTGKSQGTADLDKLAALYKSVDDATYRRIVDAQVGGMDRATRKTWDGLSASDRNDFFDKVMDGKDIALPGDEKLMEAGNDKAALRLKLQSIADNTLTFKADHFRSFWKVVPGTGEERTPDRTRRGPLRGDRGMLKRSTLPDVSTGIENGGVLVSTNPQKLFEMAQSSSLRYITALNMWKELGDLGMRKFVALGDRAPEGWVPVNDSIAKVYFPVDALSVPKDALPDTIDKDELRTRKTLVHTGDWYLESSAGRLLNNYLSKNWFQTNAVGRGLMAVKNLSTAVELSLSPFHLVFESLEAMGSQFGLGAMHVMNVGIGQGKLSGFLEGGKAMAGAPLAPFTLSRTGGSAIKATANLKEFAATARGKAFLKAFPDAAHLIDLAFTGGLTMGMPADYRVNLMESARAAFHDGNYFGAIIRAVPGTIQAAMNPLFEYFIPRLKMGFFLQAMSQQVAEKHDALMNGEISEAELARKVVNSTENRFGELNFTNLFWDNTFKGAAQLMFRSVTWKLGNWRGAATGVTGQAKAFADPLKAMYDDVKGNREGADRKTGDYIPKLDLNMSWLLGMAVTTAIVGTVLSKLISGKFPWEYLDEDKDRGMSTPGALALEMAHPRTGKQDSYTGAPTRLSLPTGLKDFEHGAADPRGYLRGSESGFVGKALDTWDNRDAFGNYVYDPNGSTYRKLADILTYNRPLPITVQSVMQGKKTGDYTRAKLGMVGLTQAPKDLDLSPLEKHMEAVVKAKHVPETPEERDEYQAKMQGIRDGSIGGPERARAMKAARKPYLLKMFSKLSYFEARNAYENFADEHEKHELRAALMQKRANAMKRSPSTTRNPDRTAE